MEWEQNEQTFLPKKCLDFPKLKGWNKPYDSGIEGTSHLSFEKSSLIV